MTWFNYIHFKITQPGQAALVYLPDCLQLLNSMSAALSIWEKESFYAPQDILIVGAGLMGLWTALELKQRRPSLKITLLERNTIPLGASTRNAGFACFGSPTELLHNAAEHGTDSMLQAVEMRYKGIEKIRAHFADSTIDFDACGGYECISKDYRHWPELDEQVQWLNQLLRPITKQSAVFERRDAALSSFGLRGFDALIENKTEAALHSGKLLQLLISKVTGAGVQILYGINVTNWQASSQEVIIETDRAIQIRGKKLVCCTNAFTAQLVPEIAVTPARGQIILTSPIPQLSMKGTFHFDEGFYYWRNLGNRILIGGARNADFSSEETLDMTGSDKIKQALLAFLQDHLHPSVQFSIEHHWSGIMGFTADKRPFVGKVSDHVYAAIACNGMGVALTPVVAEQLADKLFTDF